MFVRFLCSSFLFQQISLWQDSLAVMCVCVVFEKDLCGVSTVCGCVWLCVAVCGYVWLCVVVCGCVWLCVVVCGCVWLCVVACGWVWLFVDVFG